MATFCIRTLLLLGVCLLVGCASHGKARRVTGNRFAVTAPKSQFYKYGPAQAYGADASLPKGQKVTMLVRQFGFSQIRLDDGTTGYVATEDLTQLPPEKQAPKPAAAIASRRRAPSAPVAERQLDLSDVPVPMLPQ